jgi:hypothetical protein
VKGKSKKAKGKSGGAGIRDSLRLFIQSPAALLPFAFLLLPS